MKKTIVGITLGSIILLGALASTGFGNDGNFSERESAVKEKIVNTFSINMNEYKAYSTNDIYNDSDTNLKDNDLRIKIAYAIFMLHKDKEFKRGDFKPIVFVKGNQVLISIKHPDESFSLTEFDVSQEQPIKGKKQIKLKDEVN